jgi:hypothetical protein
MPLKVDGVVQTRLQTIGTYTLLACGVSLLCVRHCSLPSRQRGYPAAALHRFLRDSCCSCWDMQQRLHWGLVGQMTTLVRSRWSSHWLTYLLLPALWCCDMAPVATPLLLHYDTRQPLLEHGLIRGARIFGGRLVGLGRC